MKKNKLVQKISIKLSFIFFQPSPNVLIFVKVFVSFLICVLVEPLDFNEIDHWTGTCEHQPIKKEL